MTFYQLNELGEREFKVTPLEATRAIHDLDIGKEVSFKIGDVPFRLSITRGFTHKVIELTDSPANRPEIYLHILNEEKLTYTARRIK